jgi:hypothetical protein
MHYDTRQQRELTVVTYEGMVYPCYGILCAKSIAGFQLSGHEMRITGMFIPSGGQSMS